MTDSPISSVASDGGPTIVQSAAPHARFSSGSITSSKGENVPSMLNMSARGHILHIAKDMILMLPESLLVCLFPTGLVLDESTLATEEERDVKMVYVDYNPEILRYVLDYFTHMANEETGGGPIHEPPGGAVPGMDNLEGMQGRPAVIVLKEDLEFYPLILDENGAKLESEAKVKQLSKPQWALIKRQTGTILENDKRIFDGLRKNAESNDEAGDDNAEKHLIDMLCSSGFDINDKWHTRQLEPRQARITSLSLTRLSTDPELEKQQELSGNVTSTQKLMLFWRKPARKCWWDHVVLDVGGENHKQHVKVWLRKVWTLELCIVAQA